MLCFVGRRLLAVCLLGLGACSPARREVETDIVRRVRFEGNGGWFSGQNDLQLRAPMVQRQSPPLTFTFPFMYFNQPSAYDQASIDADGRRIQVWYAHHGWFDAQFLGWEVRRIKARSDKRAGVVDLIGHVRPGEPSIVRKLDVKASYEDRAIGTLIRATIANGPIHEGDTFDLESVQTTRQALQDAFKNHGEAYATVEVSVHAWPAEHAVEVTYTIEPGIRARFGPVIIEGLQEVETEVALDSLTFDYHDPTRPEVRSEVFSLQKLQESQQRLYETGMFSLVDVQPIDDDPTSPLVPIRLKLHEAKFRRFRIGGGVASDYFTVRPQLSAEYHDVRLGGSKLQLDLSASGGAIIGVVRDDDQQGLPTFFTGAGELRLNYPWLAHRKLGLSGGVRARNDLQFGSLPYWSLSTDFGMRYAFTRRFSINLGPKFEYFEYYSLTSEERDATRLQFGPSFNSDNYRLLSFDIGVRYDRRDNILSPHRGSYWAADLRQSIPIPDFSGSGFEDGFLYARIDAEVRAWQPFRFSKKDDRLPVVLAARAHARVVLPERGLDAPVPYPDLGFLGGPNSLRGFRTNQVGPYDLVCSYDGGRPMPPHNNGQSYDVDRTYLPQGGRFAIEGSTELRYDWAYGLSFAVFGDVGVLANQFSDLRRPARDLFRYGAGVGLRYATPIGPIRIDLGLRPLFAEDTGGPASSYGCNSIDTLPRAYDLSTSTRAAREAIAAGDPDSRIPPLAINLFLAIGEAF